MLITNAMLCIEMDENHHKKYITYDENIRYDNLFMDLSGKYMFIRYSPDKFVDTYNTPKNPFFQKRMDWNSIEKHIRRTEHGLK